MKGEPGVGHRAQGSSNSWVAWRRRGAEAYGEGRAGRTPAAVNGGAGCSLWWLLRLVQGLG